MQGSSSNVGCCSAAPVTVTQDICASLIHMQTCCCDKFVNVSFMGMPLGPQAVDLPGAAEGGKGIIQGRSAATEQTLE